METEKFIVANVKCQGCAANIRSGLEALDGVSSVAVDVASGQVEVAGDALDKERLRGKLAELGYPERES